MSRRKSSKLDDDISVQSLGADPGIVAGASSVMSAHSGTPDITIQQWAILLRCKSDKPVSVEAVIRCAMEWFTPALSMSEITRAMDMLIHRGWLAFDAFEQTAQATVDGRRVADLFVQPVSLADAWNSFSPGWTQSASTETSDVKAKGSGHGG